MEEGFFEALQSVINKYSIDNDVDCPDFIIAQFLTDQLENLKKAIKNRDQWANRISVGSQIARRLCMCPNGPFLPIGGWACERCGGIIVGAPELVK